MAISLFKQSYQLKIQNLLNYTQFMIYQILFHQINCFENSMIKTSILLILITAVCCDTISNKNYLQGLKLDPQLVSDTNSAISSLNFVLNNNFVCQNGNTVLGFGLAGMLNFQGSDIGKIAIYNAAIRVQQQLSQVRQQLNSLVVNNVIVGNKNYLGGKNNVIIGNHDMINGNNHWIFTSGYRTNESDMLVVDYYQLNTSKIAGILNDPHQVIHCLNNQQKQQYFNRMGLNNLATLQSQISALRVLL